MKKPFYLASPENWFKNSHNHFALIFWDSTTVISDSRNKAELPALAVNQNSVFLYPYKYYETGRVFFPVMPRLADVHA